MDLFNLPDDVISNEIHTTHVHEDGKFDVESLFIVVKNILKRATQIAEKFVLGTPAPTDHLEEKFPNANFSPPFCTIKHIRCEMQCTAAGVEIAHKTTVSILKKLSNYSWCAKAVLTLAAFAVDYGEFWLLDQIQPSDQFAKSVGIQWPVAVLLKPPSLEKHRKALNELNNIIKVTLEVIECIFEFEELSRHIIPSSLTGLDKIPMHVYWAIVTVVASTTQLCCLINDEDKTQELDPFSQKLKVIITKLKKQITICRKQREETDTYSKIVKLVLTSTEIVEVIKVLTYTKDKVVQPLMDGSTKKEIDIEVLRRKNILLVISGLDISDDDISILKSLHESMKVNDQYKILWIPIVDQWTDELKLKFKSLASKMTWYIVEYFSPMAGIKYIKENWHYKNKLIIVVLDPQGKVICENAIHLIRVWRYLAFPFTLKQEETLSNRTDWIGNIATDADPKLKTWIEEQKFILFYGGQDNEWIEKFQKRATEIFVNDKVIKEANIAIELFNFGEDHHGILGRFWTGIESLLISKTQRKTEKDAVFQEIQKLLSLKNGSGWALLSKGSTVVFSGYGTRVVKALEAFENWKKEDSEKWKEDVRKKGLESVLKEYYDKVPKDSRTCRRIDISHISGKIPENMKCPDCEHTMETYISFNCCHPNNAASADH